MNWRGRVCGFRINVILMVGMFLEFSFFFRMRQYFQNDFNFKEVCCNIGYCDWYYEV